MSSRGAIFKLVANSVYFYNPLMIVCFSVCITVTFGVSPQFYIVVQTISFQMRKTITRKKQKHNNWISDCSNVKVKYALDKHFGSLRSRKIYYIIKKIYFELQNLFVNLKIFIKKN